jgi:hypothetical protein
MDELKQYLNEYYDIDLNDLRCNGKLYELITIYGNDQYEEGYRKHQKIMVKVLERD